MCGSEKERHGMRTCMERRGRERKVGKRLWKEY